VTRSVTSSIVPEATPVAVVSSTVSP